jgi:hypothetical protein
MSQATPSSHPTASILPPPPGISPSRQAPRTVQRPSITWDEVAALPTASHQNNFHRPPDLKIPLHMSDGVLTVHNAMGEMLGTIRPISDPRHAGLWAATGPAVAQAAAAGVSLPVEWVRSSDLSSDPYVIVNPSTINSALVESGASHPTPMATMRNHRGLVGLWMMIDAYQKVRDPAAEVAHQPQV